MELSVQYFRALPKDVIISEAKKATEKMFETFKIKERLLSETYSDKAKEIVSIVKNNDFGCKKESVLKLCEALTGEKLMGLLGNSNDKLFKEFDWQIFACFIMTSEINNFSNDEILIVTNDGGFVFSIEGLKNNDIDEYEEEGYEDEYMNSNFVRPATDQEIENFINKLYPLLQK